MASNPNNHTDFHFDPSDFVQFQKLVQSISTTDPFKNSALKEVLIYSEAIYELPAVIRRTAPRLKKVLLVIDKTPMLRDQASLKPLVAQILAGSGFLVMDAELEGDKFGVVHPDFNQVEVVFRQIHQGVVVVGLGSGVIVDICKYACFLYDQGQQGIDPVPFISVPTANSVPAYSSSMAIISKDGVKRTWPTRLPDVILCDLKVLRDCPRHLNLGGIGDMCAMYIASLEWFLGIYLNIIPDTPEARFILEDARALLIQYASVIGKQTLKGMEIMAKILTLGGLAMTFAGDSTPMSGYEHGVAHLLDMGADYFGRPVRNHGSQVAVAGILAVLMFERLLDSFEPEAVDVDQCYPDTGKMEHRIRETFAEIDPSGAMGTECWRDYQRKITIWKNARPGFEQLLREWQSVSQIMRTLILPSETYVKLLSDSGHPLTFQELEIAEAEAHWAFRNAYMLRKRVSTADLLIFMGLMDEHLEEWVFSEAQNLVKQARREHSL